MAHWPATAIPIAHAHDLAALAAYYSATLGFELLLEVPATVALLGMGPVRLQLWQRAGLTPRSSRIDIEDGGGSIFHLHARLTRHARNAIAEASPMLRPWGAWEFTLCDCQGNRLTFSEPAAPAAGLASTRGNAPRGAQC